MSKIGDIKKIFWDDKTKALIQAVNPKLAKTIASINPTKDFYLYKATYAFGSKIVDRGDFHIPLAEKRLLSIQDKSIPNELKEDFSYADGTLPIGVVIQNSYEVFIENGDQLIPIVVPSEGSILSLWKNLDHSPSFHPIELFSLYAGARSIFMLPNVSDNTFHTFLKRDFNLPHNTPTQLREHFNVFKSIAKFKQSDWKLEIIFFPSRWVNEIVTNRKWHELYLLLLKDAWITSACDRNIRFYEFALSCIQEKRNLKPNPYVLDTATHLFSIALGSFPGFKPATDESMGPISLVQKAYKNSYRLKKYIPTILHPAHINLNDKAPQAVYYSMNLPTALRFSKRSRKDATLLFDLRELKHIMQVFLDEIKNHPYYFHNTIFSKIPHFTRFRYFHSKKDIYGEIELTKNIPTYDDRFLSAFHKDESSSFSDNGYFLRGCVGIYYNTSED